MEVNWALYMGTIVSSLFLVVIYISLIVFGFVSFSQGFGRGWGCYVRGIKILKYVAK